MNWDELPLKRIAIVSSLVIFIGAVSFALWGLKFPAPGGTPSEDGGAQPRRVGSQGGGGFGGDTQPTGELPTSTKPLTPPSTQNATPSTTPEDEIDLSSLTLFLASDSRGGVIGFDPNRSAFVRVDPTGTITNISDDRFRDVKGVTWSNDRTMAVIEDASGKTAYNFNTKERVALPTDWTEFSFAPDNRQIAFKNMGRRTDNQYLATTNLSNGSITLLTPLGDRANRVHVDWSPSNSAVGFATIPVDGATQQLSFINPDGSLTSSTTIEGAFFQSKWAENGKIFAFSTADPQQNFRPTLWVALGDGEHRGAYQEIPIKTTANQCSFGAGGRMMVCAVPNQNATDGYGIDGEATPAPHRIVGIDLASGVTKTFYTPPDGDTLSNPVVSKDAKKVYFTNNTTGALQVVPVQ